MDRLKVRALWSLAMLAALAVASVTGWSSWGHIVHVGQQYGEPSARFLPVAVDGMMIAGTALCGVDRLRGYKSRRFALACLWTGSALTLLFNAASAYDRGWIAVGIACVYAIALLLTVEAIFRGARHLLDRFEAVAETVSMPVQAVVTTPEPVEVAEPTAVTVQAVSEPHSGQDGTLPTVSLTKRRARPRKRAGNTVATVEVDTVDTVEVG